MSTRSLVLVLCFAAPLAAQEAANDKQELEKLQGDWVQVSATVRGRPTPADKLIPQATLKGDQWSNTLPAPAVSKGALTYKLNGSTDPKTIDITGTSGNVSRLGIYKLEGDTLTICSETAGGERPKEFKATDSTSLQIWKRASKASK